MTRVVHCKQSAYDIYIGRPGPWGNRYSHVLSNVPGVVYVGTRDEAIRRYEEEIRSDPEIVARIKAELKGKVLGCWCYPLACHGDVLARIAEEP